MTQLKGFALGVLFAVVMGLGVLKLPHSTAPFMSFLGFIATVYTVIFRKSMINPTADGFVSGFCWIYGLVSL